MGDMADHLLECVEDFEESVVDYRQGKISTLEAYDRGIVDELGFEALPSSGKNPSIVTCRCCKEGGLSWGQSQGKWRLFHGDSLHRCKANPLK